jgi:hypothetical protein
MLNQNAFRLLLPLLVAGCTGDSGAASGSFAAGAAILDSSQVAPEAADRPGGESLPADVSSVRTAAAGVDRLIPDSISAGVDILFRDSGASVGAADQVEIFLALGLATDPATPGMLLDGTCALPVQAHAQARDLNGDGVLEVIVELGSTCLYGGTGVGTTLFIRDALGSWHSNLGFAGIIEAELQERRGGFPDLQIGGMSGCRAIWGWDGSRYDYIRADPSTPGACDHLR